MDFKNCGSIHLSLETQKFAESVVKMLVQRWSDVLVQISSSRRNWDGPTKPRLEFQGSDQKQPEQQQHFTVGGDVNRLCSYSTMSSPPFGPAPGGFKRKRDLDEYLRRGSTKKTKLLDFVIAMLSRLLLIPNQKRNLIDNFNLTGGHGTSSDKCRSRYSCLYIVCKVLPEKSDLEETRRVPFLAGAAAAAHATSIDECVSRYVWYKYPFSKDLLAEEKFGIESEKSQESRRDFRHGDSEVLLSQCSTMSNMNLEDRVKDIALNVIGDIPEDIDESCGNLKVRMVPSNCEYSGDADCENVHLGVINPSVSMQMDWHVEPVVETTTNVVVDSHELQPPMQCVVEVPPILGTTQHSSYATDNSDCDDSADAAGIMGGGGGGDAQNLRRTCRPVETVAASSFPAGHPSFKSARKRRRTMCGSSESIDGEEFKVTDSPDSEAEEEEIAPSLLESFPVNISGDHGVESSSNVLLEGATCCKQPMILSTSSQLLMLPEDLQNKVFAKLQARDVFRLRTCCPAFRDLPNRNSFKQARSIECRDDLESMYSPMFFSVHNDVLEWAGYDLTLQEWRTLPSLNCLPSPDPGLLKEFLIAGGDGLLCFTVGKLEDPKLVVCNPLTQETRVLPQMNFPRHPVLMHLLVDRCKNSYKVIVAGSSTTGTEDLCRKTEVYCSKTGSWVVTGELPGPDFGLNEYQNGALCDGVLYCIAIADNTAGDKVVLAYHVEKGIWLTNWYCPIPSFRCQVYFATTQIVGFGGSIFVFSEQEYRKDVKFCIARLDCIEMGPTKQKYYMEQPNWSSASNLSEQPGLVRPYGEAPEAYKPENMWSSLINKHMDSELWERILKEPKKGKWTKLLQEPRQGSRGLLVYPENTCVAQESENKLCIFNTVERTMVIHDFENNNSCNNNQTRTELRRNKKKFHSLNPLGFTFKPNFNASV